MAITNVILYGDLGNSIFHMEPVTRAGARPVPAD